MSAKSFLNHSLLGEATLLEGPSPIAEAVEEGLPIFGPETTTRVGKQHTPIVKAPRKVRAGQWFEVEVGVGYFQSHPNEPDHYIDAISLMVDGVEVASMKFQPGQGAPRATFVIKIDEPGVAYLRGFGNCTLHGLWVSEPVKVEVI
jgi:superoxide reductase